MIIDLERFIREERPYWEELEKTLIRVESDVAYRFDLAAARRLHYLYERTSTGLSRLSTFASEPELHRYLEALVARAYGEIHEVRGKSHRFAPLRWAYRTFPRTFRRNVMAFWLTVGITLAGSALGGAAVSFDVQAKDILMPFPHLQIDPRERVAEEEKVGEEDERQGTKVVGTSFYFTHNTQVAITTLGLGAIWGLGTIIILFMNGVMMGAVTLDYINAGETTFLAGWLLPHGAIEIPAILIAGQGGLLLGKALIGWDSRLSIKARLRAVTPDLLTLIAGVAIMLAWAGFIEASLSQYHEPVIPYWVKIWFGTVELILLTLFLALSGRKRGLDEEA
ncbi:MAG: stage II sporulation protein M [Candidatus Hydrogenedentes bacterium]|nr:stage II sporulation protein M [Candidatus Hydrogenedentota bacterium]